MKCILCSTEIEEGMTECPKCGSSFGIPQKEQPAQPVEEKAVEEPVVEEQPPVAEEPTPVVETPPVDNNSLGTVNVNNVPEQPVTPPEPSGIINNIKNSEPNPYEMKNSSIVPIIFIIIIICGIGYVGYLLLTGHKIFGEDSITEDVTTVATTTTEGTIIDTTTVTTTESVVTTEPTTTTTVKADLTKENFITDIDNYTMSVTMRMSVSGVSMTISATGVVDQKNKRDSIKLVTTSSGRMISMQAYYDFNTGYLYMQDPTQNNKWIKQKNNEHFVDLNSYIKQLNSNKNVTKVGEGHYKIKISKDELKGMMSQSGVNSSLIKGEPELDVYSENGYITKVEADFSNIISGISTYKVSNKFSKFNESGNVEIPQNVIDTATAQ